MDNKKDNKYHLKNIVTDLAFIIKHTDRLTLEELEANEILLDYVTFQLIQISENSDKLTDNFQSISQQYPMAVKASLH